MSLNDFAEREINSNIDTMRHSCAHIMAHAISRLYPKARFGIGPTTEDGFYYDIEIDARLTPEDLPVIEAEMKKIINTGHAFERKELSIKDAIEYFEKSDQKFKVETLVSPAAAKD